MDQGQTSSEQVDNVISQVGKIHISRRNFFGLAGMVAFGALNLPAAAQTTTPTPGGLVTTQEAEVECKVFSENPLVVSIEGLEKLITSDSVKRVNLYQPGENSFIELRPRDGYIFVSEDLSPLLIDDLGVEVDATRMLQNILTAGKITEFSDEYALKNILEALHSSGQIKLSTIFEITNEHGFNPASSIVNTILNLELEEGSEVANAQAKIISYMDGSGIYTIDQQALNGSKIRISFDSMSNTNKPTDTDMNSTNLVVEVALPVRQTGSTGTFSYKALKFNAKLQNTASVEDILQFVSGAEIGSISTQLATIAYVCLRDDFSSMQIGLDNNSSTGLDLTVEN